MENPQKGTDSLQKISFTSRLSQVSLNSEGYFQPRYGLFGQGGSKQRFIPCLGLLNVVLLIVAVVLGIYCARVKEGSLPASHLAASQLINELNLLSGNHSDMIRAEEEAKKALETALKDHAKLKEQTEQKKTINDDYLKQIQALRAEKKHLQSNISALEGTCGRCLSGWTLFNSTCYFMSYSEHRDVKKSWQDSREDCISRGADLIVIDNQEEQVYVSDSIKNTKTTFSRWNMNGFWIGLTKAEAQGTWVWINNVTEVEQRYWMDGQPNNNGQGQDCGAAVDSSTSPWKTRFNTNCDKRQLHWICEMLSS